MTRERGNHVQTQDRQKVVDATRVHPSAPLAQTTPAPPARTEDGQGDANGGQGVTARKLVQVAVMIFLISSVTQMAFDRWMTALFYSASAFLFLARGGIDKWPKPARVLFIIAYVALGLGMLYEALLPLKLFR